MGGKAAPSLNLKIKRLVDIGIALSAERDIGRLLELIVDAARELTNADGGTLYIVSDNKEELYFSIIQNNTLNIRQGGTGDPISWESVRLKNHDGTPNYSNVSAYAALSGMTVNIPDVYKAKGFDFQGPRQFDSSTGYRTISMLVVPMKDHENEIIGVLQLLNAMEKATGKVIPFSKEMEEITESFASQAAVALTNRRLIQDLENLLRAIISTIAVAIDEKSPYTGGHIRKVAGLAMAIAEKINKADYPPFKDVHLDEAQMKELEIAAWLHDIGKIATPEHIMDKSKKLETIFDRMELIKTRFEVLKRDYEIERLSGVARDPSAEAIDELKREIEFLEKVNCGDEGLTDEMRSRIEAIGKRRWMMDGVEEAFLKEDEIENLSIRRGTLTDKEREIINAHAAITHRMLSGLPFPKKMANVALYAASHHERLDGKGYPQGLTEKELPIQARIIALADIFEALTAADRPYKKGKRLQEVIEIMASMARNRQIDPDLFELFIKEGLHFEYATKAYA